MHTYTYTEAYTYTRIHICIILAHISVCMCVCARAHTHKHTYIYIYIYICRTFLEVHLHSCAPSHMYIKTLSHRTMMIYSVSKWDDDFKFTDIFLAKGFRERVIQRNIKFTITFV